MKKFSWKRCGAWLAVAAALPLGALFADDKEPASPREVADRISEELGKQLGNDSELMKEMLRKAAKEGGALKLELDPEEAKKLLGSDPDALAKQLQKLLEGAQKLDGKELKEELRGNPRARRLELDLADPRLDKLMEFYQAQLTNRRPGRNEKDHSSALDGYKPVIAAARKATARVLDGDGKQIALATVVHPSGYLVTKASELPGERVSCELANGKKLEARRMDVRESWDLALLKVDAKGLDAIQLAPGAAPDPGSFLAAPGIGELPVAIGVASVAPRNLSMSNRGFLGIGMENADGGVSVREVQRGTAAAKAGLMVGDIIFEVDGRKVDAPAQLAQAVSGRKPKDEVKLRFRRDGDEKMATAVLGSRQMNVRRNPRADRSNRMGGPLSENRDDFPNALQHDLTLRPEECGGPLVNLDGKAVGVNIARGGRVKSYAITASDLRELLAGVEGGKFSSGSPDEIERELSAAEKEIEEMERELQRKRERREALEKSLKEKKD